MINNVVYWLENAAKMAPEKVAIVDKNGQLTYGEYQKKACAIASEIIKRNEYKTKRPVVVFLEKGKEVLVSFMGIAYSGCFYSPIDVDMPKARVDKILEVLEPAIVITSRELRSKFEEFSFQGTFIIYEEIVESEDDVKLVQPILSRTIDTDILYVLFTSGSTGLPKGVSICHRSVIDYIDWVVDTFSITEMDKLGNQAPFYFDNSILDIYSCLKTMATLYIIPQKNFAYPIDLLTYIKANDINTLFWVPSALIFVAKLRAFRNVDLKDTLKRVLFCGEVMPNKALNEWRKYLPDVLYANLYGPTEITDACTYYIVDRDFSDNEPLPIGIPMRNTDVLVLNEKDEPVIGDEVGELCVRGTSLALGYYNNPEKTNEVFVQNPLNKAVPETIYRTGDLVKYNEHGELIYICRKDFQIKHLGHRIELGEIETATSAIDGVNLCCCLYDSKRQQIVLFIDTDLEKNYIKEHLSKQIPDYMIPEKIVCVLDMPINANGKIDRVKLKEFL